MNFIITSVSSDLNPGEVCGDGLGWTSSEPGRGLVLSAWGPPWPQAPRFPPQLLQSMCICGREAVNARLYYIKKSPNTCSEENSSPTLGYSPDRLHDVHQLTCHRKNYISEKKRRKRNRTQPSCLDLLDCVVPKFTHHHSPRQPSSGPAPSYPGRRPSRTPSIGTWVLASAAAAKVCLLSCRTLTSSLSRGSPNSRKHKK